MHPDDLGVFYALLSEIEAPFDCERVPLHRTSVFQLCSFLLLPPEDVLE